MLMPASEALVPLHKKSTETGCSGKPLEDLLRKLLQTHSPVSLTHTQKLRRGYGFPCQIFKGPHQILNDGGAWDDWCQAQTKKHTTSMGNKLFHR
jgi:hypothetical protein